MMIRFRCIHCDQLQSITDEMSGETVECAMCGEETLVPLEDEFTKNQPIFTKQPVTTSRDDDDIDEGFVLRRPVTDFGEMDLTPMVDVTFLLLIFFMVTASFSLQKTLAFPPPDPDEQGAQQSIQTLDDFKKDSIIVEIDEQNAIFLDDVPLENSDQLIGSLREKSRLEQKFELVIDAHAQALHETVVKVVDAANEIGMQKIRLTTVRATESN